MIINLFEINIEPTILKLYVSDWSSSNKIKTDEIFAKISSDSMVSLESKNQSRPIVTGFEKYILWLLKDFFFKRIEKSNQFFDVQVREGFFALIDEKIHRDEYLSILREVTVRFHLINEKFYVSVLPKTGIYNRITLSKLLALPHFNKDFFVKHPRALIYVEKDGFRGWCNGFIKSISDSIKVEIPEIFNGTISVEGNRIIPKLRKIDYSFDPAFYQRITKISKASSSNSPKELFNITSEIVSKYIEPVFKGKFGGYELTLKTQPLQLQTFLTWDLGPADSRLQYVFKRNKQVFFDTERLKGLSKFNFTQDIKEQNVVLFATKETISVLESMVDSLNNGVISGNYRFDISSKFGVKLNVVDRYITSDYKKYLNECNKFVFSTEDKHRGALVIAFLPENSDIYYEFKAKLAAFGKVSQIRSKLTMDIYTAWNIAANIYAKIGFTPWSISESKEIEHADLVLGFSYSSLNVEGKLRRNIGYINVFDRNGEWKFMRSHAGILEFDKRLKIIPELVQEAIYAYLAGGASPKIIDIHYSKKFSSSEREKVFEAIVDILPEVKRVNFISLDDSHSLRIFDSKEVNYTLNRGVIVFLQENEFILSVQGNQKDKTAFRQIKVIVHTEGEKGSYENNKAIAQRILAMTKLNWRSVVKDSSEPVTLKYSNEIAKLTNHFTLTQWNQVSSNLSNIPWFI